MCLAYRSISTESFPTASMISSLDMLSALSLIFSTRVYQSLVQHTINNAAKNSTSLRIRFLTPKIIRARAKHSFISCWRRPFFASRWSGIDDYTSISSSWQFLAKCSGISWMFVHIVHVDYLTHHVEDLYTLLLGTLNPWAHEGTLANLLYSVL